MDDYEVLSRSSPTHKSLAINLKFEHGGNTKGPVNMKMKVPGLLVLVLRCSCWGLSAVMCAHRSALTFPFHSPFLLIFSLATFVFEPHRLTAAAAGALNPCSLGCRTNLPWRWSLYDAAAWECLCERVDVLLFMPVWTAMWYMLCPSQETKILN